MIEEENTETIPGKDYHIDRLNNEEALKIMLQNHLKAFKSVKVALNSIELSVNKIVSLLSNNIKSKIVYVGAGTSGRIAVQDGVELYPTFGWPLKRVKFIIAGGKKALTKSIEGAEDLKGKNIYEIVKNKIKPYDVVIGIAASGSTTFTIEVIKFANQIGAMTIGISNNKNTELEKHSNIPIILNTGTEIVAGSTRLKAGTAQKICLNLISTLVMTRLGKVKKGMMNNMIPTNKKLFLREELINSLLHAKNKGT